MPNTRQKIAQVAIVLALLVATGPMREYSPSPLAGVRTALELISKKRSVNSPVRQQRDSAGTA